MGKGVIISGGDAGRYSVQLDYDDERRDLMLARIQAKIDFYYDQISALTDQNAIARRKLWIAGLRIRQAMLQNSDRCPTDSTLEAWCADLTEDLTGNVGTIEIESETDLVLIRPGYEGNAVWDALRDGQMQALLAQDPSATLLNWMFHDARQKWKPRHRVGELSSVDHDTDTCALTIDAADGAMTEEDINIMSSFSSVPIKYMNCNSAPFEAGDRVVVEFEDNDWASPKVIGFESNPKGCDHDYVIITSNVAPWDPDDAGVFNSVEQWSIVFDVGMGTVAGEIPASATPGDFLVFPCKTDDLAYWATLTDERTSSASLSRQEFSYLEWDWWKNNPGEEAYPAGGDGVMCDPVVFYYSQIGEFHSRKFYQDRYKWASLSNASGSDCARLMFHNHYQNLGEAVGATYVYHSTMEYCFESPLGEFDPMLYAFQLNTCWKYEEPLRFYFNPIYYSFEWWNPAGYPAYIYNAVYSGNSQLQIHTLLGQTCRRYQETPGYLQPFTVEQISKLQIHASSSYHPSDENDGGINANPLAMTRLPALETAIYDLIETQLKAEDAGNGEDWSLWQEETDRDPTIAGENDSAFFDPESRNTFHVPLLYSLYFDVQFREYPEP